MPWLANAAGSRCTGKCFSYIKYRTTDAEWAALTCSKSPTKSPQWGSHIHNSGGCSLSSLCHVPSSLSWCCIGHALEFWKVNKIWDPYHTYTQTEAVKGLLSLQLLQHKWFQQFWPFSNTSWAMGSLEMFSFVFFYVSNSPDWISSNGNLNTADM